MRGDRLTQVTEHAGFSRLVEGGLHLVGTLDLRVFGADDLPLGLAAAGGLLHVKKGQFLAPWDCRNILDKIKEAVEIDMTVLCERGVSFGYNTLGIPIAAGVLYPAFG